MTVSAHDVARELRSQLPTSGVLKIHKLLYLCQGLHLAWHNEPLFVEEIEAWENGPVVADLWQDEKNQRGVPAPEDLEPRSLLVLDYVVGLYGTLSGRELIDLTHAEGPWAGAWARSWRDSRITLDEMREFFRTVDHAASGDEDDWTPTGTVLHDLQESFSASRLATGRDETDDIRRWLAEVAG